MFKPYSRRVYYYETDKMGIMHHSNYIRIFEETRVDFLQQAGFPFSEMESRGLLMPVLSVDCSYKHPLKFEDKFEVDLTITKFNGVSLYVSYIITKADTGEICATGSSSHCFTDEELKPVRTKKAHPDIFKVFNDYMLSKKR